MIPSEPDPVPLLALGCAFLAAGLVLLVLAVVV